MCVCVWYCNEILIDGHHAASMLLLLLLRDFVTAHTISGLMASAVRHYHSLPLLFLFPFGNAWTRCQLIKHLQEGSQLCCWCYVQWWLHSIRASADHCLHCALSLSLSLLLIAPWVRKWTHLQFVRSIDSSAPSFPFLSFFLATTWQFFTSASAVFIAGCTSFNCCPSWLGILLFV